MTDQGAAADQDMRSQMRLGADNASSTNDDTFIKGRGRGHLGAWVQQLCEPEAGVPGLFDQALPFRGSDGANRPVRGSELVNVVDPEHRPAASFAGASAAIYSFNEAGQFPVIGRQDDIRNIFCEKAGAENKKGRFRFLHEVIIFPLTFGSHKSTAIQSEAVLVFAV
jgi:hypothetical protein